jgi:hypothetical protein
MTFTAVLLLRSRLVPIVACSFGSGCSAAASAAAAGASQQTATHLKTSVYCQRSTLTCRRQSTKPAEVWVLHVQAELLVQLRLQAAMRESRSSAPRRNVVFAPI